MTIEEIVDLHCAGFHLSAARIMWMMKDPAHLNDESKEVRVEFDVLREHLQQAFMAKNAQREAERALEKLAE